MAHDSDFHLQPLTLRETTIQNYSRFEAKSARPDTLNYRVTDAAGQRAYSARNKTTTDRALTI